MTQEDIVRMAREAGGVDITSQGWKTWVGTQTTEFLERFAALVAAHEREWVELTDDDLRICFTSTNTAEPLSEGWNGLERFARAIIAAFKEKNK